MAIRSLSNDSDFLSIDNGWQIPAQEWIKIDYLEGFVSGGYTFFLSRQLKTNNGMIK